MFDILWSQFLFFVVVDWLLWLPGFLCVRIWRRLRKSNIQVQLTNLEVFVLSFGISITALTFGVILLDFAQIRIDKLSLILLPIGIVGAWWLLVSAIARWQSRKAIKSTNQINPDSNCAISSEVPPLADVIPAQAGIQTDCTNITEKSELSKSKLPKPVSISNKIFILLITLTIVIKGFFLSDTMFPTATDMGHHLFWTHKIAQTGELPTYAKQKPTTQIAQNSSTKSINSAQISKATPIADFIIGEHIALAGIEILTGQSPFSVTPVLFLFLLDIMGLLATLALGLRIFGAIGDYLKSAKFPQFGNFTQNSGALLLLLAGPLWAISGAGAKFVSGGVIGNLFGNFYIPLILLALLIALTSRSARWLTLTIALAAGLIWTHHLSTFILIYIIVFGALFLAIFNWRDFVQNWRSWLSVVFSPWIAAMIGMVGIIAIFIWLPSYLNPSDIASATGAPEKSTRTGLGFAQITHTIGEVRFAFGLIGLGLILMLVNLRKFTSKQNCTNLTLAIAASVLLAWSLAPLLMSTIPQFLSVNIISSRIANYTAIPFALIGALGLAWLIGAWRVTFSGSEKYKFAQIGVVLLLSLPILTGMYDNSQSLKSVPNIQLANQVIASAEFVNQQLGDFAQNQIAQNGTINTSNSKEIWTLKDHNYLTADTWMKLVFNRDYSYPLSRSYFKRYDKPGREQCTRIMIGQPNSADAQTCFNDLNVRYIIVNPDNDSAQFTKSRKFDKIYTSNNVSVFYRK